MGSFPLLSSLVSKNRHCKLYFEKSLKGYTSLCSINASVKKIENSPVNLCDKNRQCLSSSNEKKSLLEHEKKHNFQKEDCASAGGESILHWKKIIQKKFHNENKSHHKRATGKVVYPAESALANNWNFDLNSFRSLHHGQLSNIPSCTICEESFKTHRPLNKDKTLVHFPPHGSEKELCYLPFFTEPKKLDRTILQRNQIECQLCQKWFGGVATDKLDDYLNELKLKTKPKEQYKRREKKCKSMTRKVCELCSKILSNRKGLERHMLIHTGEKPYPCDVCGKPFRRKDNCARHKKTAHLFKKPRKPRQRRDRNVSSNANCVSTK